MRIRWKRLGLDTLMVVTFPLWIIPALALIFIWQLVEGFVENYIED